MVYVVQSNWACLSSTYKAMDRVQKKPNSSVQDNTHFLKSDLHFLNVRLLQTQICVLEVTNVT
jgi:hypothetical protein